MSDTTIGSDATGPVLSGTFSGEVHIATGADADAIAQQLLRDYGPPMANLKATMGTQQRLVELETKLARRFEHEDMERAIRQQETDEYRRALERRIAQLEAANQRSFWTGAVALLAAAGSWARRMVLL